MLLSEQYHLDDKCILFHHYTNRRRKTNVAEKHIIQIVIPACFVQRFLKAFHDDQIHASKNKLFLSLKLKYYWNQQYQSCAQYVKTCKSCQMRKHTTIHTSVPTKPLEIYTQPFSSITIDTVGPLTPTPNGHRYILSVQCDATRYVLLFPIKDQTAQTIADTLFSSVFCVFGFPVTCHSDRANSFFSQLTQLLFKLCGIKHIASSSYHPQSQSRLQGVHKPLMAALRMYPNCQQSWDIFVSPIQHALNASPREEVAIYSPAELLFGRKFAPPALVSLQNIHIRTNDIEKYVCDLKDRLRLMTSVVCCSDRSNRRTGGK